jgi:hypothetical protein
MSRSRKRDGLSRRENGIFAFRFKSEEGKWREKYTGSTDRTVALSFKRDFLENLQHGTLPTEMAIWRLDQAENWWIDFADLVSHRAPWNPSVTDSSTLRAY